MVVKACIQAIHALYQFSKYCAICEKLLYNDGEGEGFVHSYIPSHQWEAFVINSAVADHLWSRLFKIWYLELIFISSHEIVSEKLEIFQALKIDVTILRSKTNLCFGLQICMLFDLI